VLANEGPLWGEAAPWQVMAGTVDSDHQLTEIINSD
jgi:hypothetical protein